MSVKKQVCGPCLEENAEIEGVVYCRQCEAPLCGQCQQDHARIKALKHHKLCDLADVPSKEIQELLKKLIACPKHEKEEVCYLCKDHDVTCCSKCVTADHRKCEEVKVLSDIVHDIKVDCTELNKALHDLQQKADSLLEHERKHEELLSDIEGKALSSLQTTKQKVLHMLAKLENELLSAIANKKKVIEDKIQTNNEKSRQFLNDIKQQSSYIEHVEKFGTYEHVVLLQRQLEKDSVCRLKTTADELENNSSKSSFTCVEDTSFDSLLLEIKNSLRIEDFTCDVSQTGSDTDNSHNKPYAERIPQLQSTKDLRSLPMFDKEKYPDPCSCIWIDKYIVISLRAVNALLVIEESSDFVLSKFSCDSVPYSVSKTGATDMVIIYTGKFACAQLRYGNVHVVTELKTRDPYDDVTRHAPLNQYICLSTSKWQIDILNNDGTLFREISFSPFKTECAQSSLNFCHFNACNHMLFISNFLSNKLIALNLNGEKGFEYNHRDLSGPSQLAVDPSGNVYVTSFRGSIHQISQSGQHIRSLPLEKGIFEPCGICLNNMFDKIALIGGKGDTAYLQVYTFT